MKKAKLIIGFLIVVIAYSLTSCTKTIEVEKIVRDTIYINKTVRDTIVFNNRDTIYIDKIKTDTLLLGADVTLPTEVKNFLNTNLSTYNTWLNGVKNYYDGWTNKVYTMEAVACFYGPISMNSFDNSPGQNKLIFLGFYQGKIMVSVEYNFQTKIKTNEIRMSVETNAPGLLIPDQFLIKNKLVDVVGQTAFIVRR